MEWQCYSSWLKWISHQHELKRIKLITLKKKCLFVSKYFIFLSTILRFYSNLLTIYLLFFNFEVIKIAFDKNNMNEHTSGFMVCMLLHVNMIFAKHLLYWNMNQLALSYHFCCWINYVQYLSIDNNNPYRNNIKSDQAKCELLQW